MKPKHHKAGNCPRNNQCSVKQSSSYHHKQHQSSIERKVQSLGIISSSSDTEDNEPLEPICKESKRKSCTRKSCKSQLKSSNLLKLEDEDVEDDNQLEGEKYDDLFQSVRARREQLVERLRIYNSLFKLNNAIKNDQVYLYRKLQDMDELYLRNTAAILRLGFCPCLVHQQTSSVGESLMTIHRNLRVWDKKMEEICDILKEPSTRKTTAAVLRILNISDNSKFAKNTDFSDIALPEIVWDLDNPFLEQVNTTKLLEDWKKLRTEVRDNLCEVEITFQEICLEFGITRGPEQSPSHKSELGPFTYENIIMSEEKHDDVNTQIQSVDTKDGNGGITNTNGSCNDPPDTKVSSSIL